MWLSVIEKWNIKVKPNMAILRTKGEADDVSMPLKIFLDYVDGKKSEDALMQEINT